MAYVERLQTLSIAGFNNELIAQANSFFNISRQVSISLGITIFSILISAGLKLHGSEYNLINHTLVSQIVFQLGFWLIPIIAILGIKFACKLDKVS